LELRSALESEDAQLERRPQQIAIDHNDKSRKELRRFIGEQSAAVAREVRLLEKATKRLLDGRPSLAAILASELQHVGEAKDTY
jgi:hypothetical protein